MSKRNWLIVVNVAAFVFLMLSVYTMVETVADFCNIAIPSVILFGTNLGCLLRLTRPDKSE